MLVYLLIGSSYGFACAVQPGPLQTYLITQALNCGWRRTAPAAFAPLISDGPIALLAVVVLSRVSGWMEQVLHVLGGLFVLYLAVGAMKAWRGYNPDTAGQSRPNQQNVLKAALVNFLNPNPYIGWSLVMGPLLLKGWREAPANGIAFLASFYTTLIACMVGIIIIFSAARKFGPKVNRAMIGVSAIALACFGFYQLGLAAAHWWK